VGESTNLISLGEVVYYQVRISFEASGQRTYVGLLDGGGGFLTTDGPNSHNFIGFRYSNTASDAKWKAVCWPATAASGSGTVTNTNVNFDTSAHTYALYYDGSTMHFFIDGNEVATIANSDSNFPVIATTLRSIGGSVDKNGVTQENAFRLYSIYRSVPLLETPLF
jgi:hypothetical protein